MNLIMTKTTIIMTINILIKNCIATIKSLSPNKEYGK